MITSLNSGAGNWNERLVEVDREAEEDTVQWIARALPDLGEGLAILLTGGVSHYDFVVRAAQSRVRHDRTPSNWSSVALFAKAVEELVESEELAKEEIYEISLYPPAALGFPPEWNALQMTSLARYADATGYPNVALIVFPGVSKRELDEAISTFRNQQVAVDGSALLLRWLGYAWGIGDNPLTEGHGVPSAAMVDEVGLVLGLDLTPGLESRASCPESIWQAVRWWHEYYEEANKAAPRGVWTTPHWLLAEHKK